MNSERRACARHPADVPVQIRYRRRRFIGAQGRNLSIEGMYLEVRNLTLPCGTLVDLELESSGRSWLIPAIVVHRDGSGVGVMFCDPQPALADGLPAREPGPHLRNHRIGAQDGYSGGL